MAETSLFSVKIAKEFFIPDVFKGKTRVRSDRHAFFLAFLLAGFRGAALFAAGAVLTPGCLVTVFVPAFALPVFTLPAPVGACAPAVGPFPFFAPLVLAAALPPFPPPVFAVTFPVVLPPVFLSSPPLRASRVAFLFAARSARAALISAHSAAVIFSPSAGFLYAVQSQSGYRLQP
jgi:hypothetical protein